VTQPIDPADWLRRLELATAGFAALLDSADLERAVPGCPGWSLADLATHLGGVHEWAEHAVVAGNPHLVADPAPTEPAELVRWYAQRARSLLATLSATGPDAPAWAFRLEDGRSGFWRRRQTHETTVHLWDATRSQGVDVSIDAALAADGIDEIATVLFPRQVRLGRMTPVRAPVALRPTDADGPAAVLAGDGTVRLQPEAAVATVHAPAEALLLLLWKRILPDDERLIVTGDRAAYLDLLTRALTP
jgi:uncharacterized protein (TIGR03083 family)